MIFNKMASLIKINRPYSCDNQIRNILLIIISLILISPGICFTKTIKIKDQANRIIEVKQPVKKVVTTFIPATLFALCADLKNQLVGASIKDRSASIFEALIDKNNLPVAVGNRTCGLNLETIFSLSPDLVIMYGQKDGIRLADRLTKLGIPALVIRPETIADMKETLKIIGMASGRVEHTKKALSGIKRVEDLMLKKISTIKTRQRVYYASSRLLSTISGDMLQNEMISLAGGDNVSKNTFGFFVNVSKEQVLKWNPEVIFVSDRLSSKGERQLHSPGFEMIQAVKDNRIFRVPSKTYWDFPSPLSMAGVLWMAGKINPELFDNETIDNEINLLYDTFFGSGFSKEFPYITGAR